MTIPKRIASVIINSLKGGVVPRIGLPYITVGREKEINALLGDIDIISSGGASFRFIVGSYGSGKSFMLQTIRNYAMDRGFAVCDADLSPERRLQGSKGQGLATYKELMGNLSVKARPEGGALTIILDRWINSLFDKAETAGFEPESEEFTKKIDSYIKEVVMNLSEMVHGFDFAKILSAYYHAYLNDDDSKKAAVLKWFRGEYTLRGEAKADLGVSIIITDDDWYEYIKLFARFFKEAGYSGLIIMIDELVNIYKVPNGITRQYNYEKILTMYNDTLQGKARNLGFIMCGTPQCIEDTRRGVYSYEALRSRLGEGRFAKTSGIGDMLSPVIKLVPLSNEELFVLIQKLREIHGALYPSETQLGDGDLETFLKIELGRVGADSKITPREIIRDFIELMDLVLQNPSLDIKALLTGENFEFSTPGSDNCEPADPGFADFTL